MIVKDVVYTLNKDIIELQQTISSQTNHDRYIEIITNNCDYLKKFVKDFFVGKEDEILKIYDILKRQACPYNKIKFVDVNMASHLYSEYFDGLTKYVDKLISLNNDDEISTETVKASFEKIKKADEICFKNIFYGELNPEATVNIDTAMVNIETLIDINNNFSNFINLVNSMCNKIYKNKCDKYYNSIVEGLGLFIFSICKYNFLSIIHILETWDKITDSIQTRTPVVEKITSEYKIF